MTEADLVAMPVADLDPGALALHREALVVDGHVDTVLRVVAGGDLRSGIDGGHVDLRRSRAGGVDVFFFAHYVSAEYKPASALQRLMVLMDATLRQVDGGDIVIVSCAEEARTAGAAGKLGLYLTVEGGEVVHGRVEILRMLHRMGIRSMGLTWNERNQLADGVAEAASGGGLTEAGRAVVDEMSALGMVIDVSHLSPAGFWHVVERAPGPIIASHANAHALCAHPRNLTDDQIRAVAETGGVIGVTFCPPFLTDGSAELGHVLDHIEHMCALVGARHVGLGSDFDGIEAGPRGLEDVSGLPRVTAGLMGRGFSAENIVGVLGENLLRVMG